MFTRRKKIILSKKAKSVLNPIIDAPFLSDKKNESIYSSIY